MSIFTYRGKSRTGGTTSMFISRWDTTQAGSANDTVVLPLVSNGDYDFYVDWGDGTKEDWIGPYKSGLEIIINHSWNRKGNFTIRVKVKDEYNLESDWGYFHLSMPRRYKINKIFITDLLNLLINKILIYNNNLT